MFLIQSLRSCLVAELLLNGSWMSSRSWPRVAARAPRSGRALRAKANERQPPELSRRRERHSPGGRHDGASRAMARPASAAILGARGHSRVSDKIAFGLVLQYVTPFSNRARGWQFTAPAHVSAQDESAARPPSAMYAPAFWTSASIIHMVNAHRGKTAHKKREGIFFWGLPWKSL